MDYSACPYIPERIFFYELPKILLWNKGWKAEAKAKSSIQVNSCSYNFTSIVKIWEFLHELNFSSYHNLCRRRLSPVLWFEKRYGLHTWTKGTKYAFIKML